MTNPVQSGDLGALRADALRTQPGAEQAVLAKPTPGPWRYRAGYIEHENRSGFWQPIKLYSPWVQGAWETDAEAAANAQVAAAAPDLLDACKAAAFELTEAKGIRGQVRDRCLAAIAKATGETQ